MASPFGERRVVGEIRKARPGGAPMRRNDQRKVERLRRLHRAQVTAVERFSHMRRVVDLLDGVGDGDGRHSGAAGFTGDDGAADQGVSQKRPRRIVNEDDSGSARRERLEAGAHRGLPRRPAVDRRQKILQARGRGAKSSRVLRMNDRLHGADLRMGEKSRERGADHRLARDFAILLGHVAAGAQASPARNDDCGDGVSHFVLRAVPAPL